MSVRRRAITACLAAGLAVGCARHSAPSRFLRVPERAQREAYGGWIDLDVQSAGGRRTVRGELVAVTADSVWVHGANGGGVFATRDVVSGQLVGWDAQPGRVSGGAAAGAFLTISNGAFLIFTMPMWIIGGSVAAGSQSSTPIQKVPQTRWTDLAGFARFPQGMPPGLTLDGLTPAPRAAVDP